MAYYFMNRTTSAQAQTDIASFLVKHPDARTVEKRAARGGDANLNPAITLVYDVLDTDQDYIATLSDAAFCSAYESGEPSRATHTVQVAVVHPDNTIGLLYQFIYFDNGSDASRFITTHEKKNIVV